MKHVQALQCIHCGKQYDPCDVDYYCPACGYHEGILDVIYDYEAVKAEMDPDIFSAGGPRSMWRYLPLLPVAEPERISHLQVGWTPLYAVPRLAETLDVAGCWVKDEGRNPTASFKDRASAVGVLKALEKGASRITCASTGNAASSLAGFAAAAGLPASIFVPKRAPEAKVAQLLVFGAQVFSVQGTYDQAWELCMAASSHFGWYNRNCAINSYLIEGKKTVALELVEQFRERGTFPDWVVVSVGDGCTIGGVWKGFKEMQRIGWIEKTPKILGVQAAGCQPFVTAWREGKGLTPCEADTLADSIAVGHPRNFVKGLRAVTESGGAYVAVPDHAILEAMTTLARKAAVFGEPAGVTGVAGIQEARRQGIISLDDSVALIVTGNGLKDIASAIRAAGQPLPVAPELDAVRRIVNP
ncbi:threonine synthase [Heliobacterium undosum]|uniref:Threonine synthase n=1 Tax=Heliomicrobium undosum TaxID=121734 RepID=A0A845L0S0_9FIRM|nr:threonine synthase [Heliomicrobium undosum]MZP30112.1 threonine synthase [Heliomicrobium undosum]